MKQELIERIGIDKSILKGFALVSADYELLQKMKRNIRKTAILQSAVILGEILCLQGNSDITGTQTGILAGTGSRIVHGAELFAEGTDITGA